MEKMRDKIREEKIRHNTQIKVIADFLQKGLPQLQNKKVSFKSEQQHFDGENHTEERKEGSRIQQVLKLCTNRFLQLLVLLVYRTYFRYAKDN
jgi:uncharacterized protein with gpF-like domain